jgi:hypothetical protein
VYYLLYTDNCETPSKVAINPERPSLGRIRVDSVAPPHRPASIKQCISRVEETPALAYATLFADITSSCITPLKESHISILRTDVPGLSPNKPMAIVRNESPSFPDGRYFIKSRSRGWNNFIFWTAAADHNPIKMVSLWESANQNLTTRQARNAHVSEHSPIIHVFKGG